MKMIFYMFLKSLAVKVGRTRKTEHRRVAAAKTLRNYIDKNIKKSKNIIVMETNDTP